MSNTRVVNIETVRISDISKSLQVLEKTISDIDENINSYAQDILRVQKLMSDLITQRDALIATSNQILNYRKLTFPEICL